MGEHHCHSSFLIVEIARTLDHPFAARASKVSGHASYGPESGRNAGGSPYPACGLEMVQRTESGGGGGQSCRDWGCASSEELVVGNTPGLVGMLEMYSWLNALAEEEGGMGRVDVLHLPYVALGMSGLSLDGCQSSYFHDWGATDACGVSYPTHL